jgi:hypothetical protein
MPVHEQWPTSEILLTSGREWPREGDLPPGAAFLAKPCPSETLVSYVRSAAERAQTARVEHSAVNGGNSAEGTIVPFPKVG